MHCRCSVQVGLSQSSCSVQGNKVSPNFCTSIPSKRAPPPCFPVLFRLSSSRASEDLVSPADARSHFFIVGFSMTVRVKIGLWVGTHLFSPPDRARVESGVPTRQAAHHRTKLHTAVSYGR